MQNGLRHCLNNVPQRMRSGAKAVIIELQMVILLQQKIPFRKEKCSQISFLKNSEGFHNIAVDLSGFSLYNKKDNKEERNG